MGTKTLSSIVGRNSLPAFGVDTTFFTNRSGGDLIYRSISNIDASAALTEVLGLSGSWMISMVRLTGLQANDLTDIKLTVDGVVIWNETGIVVNVVNETLIGGNGNNDNYEALQCDSSFSLEVKMGVDTAIFVQYHVRPIA